MPMGRGAAVAHSPDGSRQPGPACLMSSLALCSSMSSCASTSSSTRGMLTFGVSCMRTQEDNSHMRDARSASSEPAAA